jgi:hypothetical protein
MRRWIMPPLTAGALGLLASVASAVSVASQADCLAANADAHRSYGTLQEAVDAATAGATLRVKGACYGDTAIGKSLMIVGQGQSSLNGANSERSRGIVVTVEEGVTVAISGLTITGGYSGGNYDETSGGIDNEGSLTLRHSKVADNVERGIYNAGSLTLNDSTVAGNGWGGIENRGGSVTLNASTVTRNGRQAVAQPGQRGADVGGGIDNRRSRFTERVGSLTLNDSTVADNTAEWGGGIHNQDSCSVTLNDSTVTDNTALGEFTEGPAPGGGIASEGGSLTLNRSTVAHNRTVSVGGGIWGAPTLNDSIVTGNTAREGGGIWGAPRLNA